MCLNVDGIGGVHTVDDVKEDVEDALYLIDNSQVSAKHTNNSVSPSDRQRVCVCVCVCVWRGCSMGVFVSCKHRQKLS